MGSDKKKSGKGKGSKTADGASKKAQPSLKDAASALLNEVEMTGAVLATEVKGLFDRLTEKVADIAASTAETTANVADKVASKEVPKLVGTLITDVREAGEASLRTIGEGFDSLRGNVVSALETPRTKKKKRAKVEPLGTEQGKDAEKVEKSAPSAARSATKRDVAKTTAQPTRRASEETERSTRAGAKKTAASKKTATKKTAVAPKVATTRRVTTRKVAAKKTPAKKSAAGKKTTVQ